MREADEDIAGVVRLHLVELAIVHNAANDLVHVIRFIRIVRDHIEQGIFASIAGIAPRSTWRVIHIVGGHEAEQFTNLLQAGEFGIAGEMRDAAGGRVRVGTAELLHRDVFVGHRLHHVGPGHEHVAGAAHHVDKVGDRRRIHGTTGAWSQDGRDLRYHARRHRVSQEDVGVPPERDDAFLNARAARVIQANNRRPVSHRQVHDLADLGGMCLGQRPTKYGEVLREDIDDAAFDPSVSGDDAVSVHGRFALGQRAGGDESVDLDERTLVEEDVESLAGGELALGVLGGEASGAAALF